MEKIKKCLSFAAVGVIALFGSLMLTACGNTETPANLGTLPELPAEYDTYEKYINALKDNQATEPDNLGELPALPAGYETYEDYINHLLGNQIVPDTFTVVGDWEWTSTETYEVNLYAAAGYELNGVWVGRSIYSYWDSISGKYIVDGNEYDEDDFNEVDSTGVPATRTREERYSITFNADGTFVDNEYYYAICSNYDESYSGRIYESDIEYSWDDYYRGTYTVDENGKIDLIITESGEMNENGEIEWDDHNEISEGCITLGKQVLYGEMILTKKN
jgi:hypothetical protein